MLFPIVSIVFGADPEFFFKREGKVIGAEKVLPKDGVKQHTFSTDDAIIIDGVQAEFNPLPNTCRQEFSNNLAVCFQKLAETIDGKKVEVDFGAGVEIDALELASLDKKNQTFGCSPSMNAYRDSKIQIADASKYHYRSAGGHIHIGNGGVVRENPALVVKILDIVLGNTCVLLDRDPGNVERRKNYGRAGEYRTPSHGLEYRTLSNFWLRSYPLTSFVLGMTRFGVSVAENPEATKELLSLVDMEMVERAINENDFVLAQANFAAIREFLRSCEIETGGSFPLSNARIEALETLVEKGIEYYFPEDPMTHWLKHRIDNGGWEIFADTKIYARG